LRAAVLVDRRETGRALRVGSNGGGRAPEDSVSPFRESGVFERVPGGCVSRRVVWTARVFRLPVTVVPGVHVY